VHRNKKYPDAPMCVLDAHARAFVRWLSPLPRWPRPAQRQELPLQQLGGEWRVQEEPAVHGEDVPRVVQGAEGKGPRRRQAAVGAVDVQERQEEEKEEEGAPLAAAARRRRSPPPLAAAASVDASPCSPPHLLRAQKKGAKDGDKEEL
tara:strand:- start:1734 stop:2177 length:444 start_codon:yes stop_codon:yes gene_type:complete